MGYLSGEILIQGQPHDHPSVVVMTTYESVCM